MNYLKITDSLKKEVEHKLKDYFPGRYYKTETNHYHDNRFIQFETILHDIDIHYEYYQGYVELHLEGKFSGYEYNTCLLYTSPSPRDSTSSRMPSSA